MIKTFLKANPNATKPDVVNNAKKVYAACEAQGKNETKAEFDEDMLNDENLVFRICGKSLALIHDNKFKKCPYDGSRYKITYDEQICEICSVSKIGLESMGLKFAL